MMHFWTAWPSWRTERKKGPDRDLKLFSCFASVLVAWMQGSNVVRATDKGDAAALRHHNRTFLGAVVFGFMGHEA